MENVENYPSVITKYPLYLGHCCWWLFIHNSAFLLWKCREVAMKIHKMKSRVEIRLMCLKIIIKIDLDHSAKITYMSLPTLGWYLPLWLSWWTFVEFSQTKKPPHSTCFCLFSRNIKTLKCIVSNKLILCLPDGLRRLFCVLSMQQQEDEKSLMEVLLLADTQLWKSKFIFSKQMWKFFAMMIRHYWIC